MAYDVKGIMVVLKKIFMPVVCKKVRKTVSTCLSKGVWLCFSGIDAINFHFTNSNIHTGVIEMALLPAKDHTNPDFNDVVGTLIGEFSVLLNETFIHLNNNANMTMTRDLMERLTRNSNGTVREFFQPNLSDTQKLTIDLQYNGNSYPIMEFRVMANIYRTPFDRFGLRYLPIGFVHSDFNTAQERYGGDDWHQRQELLQQIMARPDITLSFWTASEIAKECFPGVATKRIGSSKVATTKFAENVAQAPQMYLQQLNDIKADIATEVTDQLIKCLNLKSLVQRATYLGYFPDHTQFHDALDNYYNTAIVRELRTELCG